MAATYKPADVFSSSIFLKIGRIILDKQNFADTKHTVNDEVIAVLQIPHISTVLKTARLRYLSRLMRFAPNILGCSFATFGVCRPKCMVDQSEAGALDATESSTPTTSARSTR